MTNRIAWDVDARSVVPEGGGGTVGQISISRLVQELFRQTKEIQPTERVNRLVFDFDRGMIQYYLTDRLK